MNKQPHKLENSDFESVTSSLQDLSFANSVSISLCSSTISGSDSISSNISNASNDASEAKVCEKSGLCLDPNETSFRSFCPSKPHKGNDIRWDAIQYVKAKDGILGLGLGHFRLLKKLGCGDIGSVYLAELRGMGCLFAMKVMDKGMLAGRKKLLRAQTEREIMGLLDHPFLPTLYSYFETEKFSCLLMEFCSGGDLHTLRQRQPGKHFTEQAARLVVIMRLVMCRFIFSGCCPLMSFCYAKQVVINNRKISYGFFDKCILLLTCGW